MASSKKKVKRSAFHKSILHGSHTGRLVHKSHTHYPALVLLVIFCGLLLLGITTMTRAATLQVRATVLGDPPPYAAVITKPQNNDRFKSIPIDVEGTCPPDTIVKIYRNDVFSGSVVCSPTNTFALKTDLFEGKNTLIARVFNFAFVEGPVSDPVVVFYDKPVKVPPISPGPSGQPITQLFLDSDTLYHGFFTKEKIKWPVEIGGGLAPYAVSVDWGDGSSDVVSLTKAGKFNISHTYTRPGDYKGNYVIVIKASDRQGGKAYLQLVVIVNDIKLATGTSATTPTGIDSSGELPFWQNLYHQVLALWPIYILLLLFLTSFWLGERREYNLLESHNRLRKVRRRAG